jgi:hypothetical protein
MQNRRTDTYEKLAAKHYFWFDTCQKVEVIPLTESQRLLM